MSENRAMPPVPEGIFTEEQLARISGGGCSPEDVKQFLERLRENYEQLIDFTSYVIERVVGP